MIIGLGFIAAGITGWFAHRAYVDGIMLAQEKAHEKEKEFMWEEMHRLRAQVANLIGKE